MLLNKNDTMTQTYQYTISGMTCHACEALITMDLEDAGMPIKTFDRENGVMTIALEESQVDKAKQVIESLNKGQYAVTGVQSL